MSKESQGARYNNGKIRWSLLSIPALQELVKVLEFGAKKYDSWNWSKGLSWTDTYDSLQRHLQAWMRGEDRDPETGLSHIAHVLCNAMFLLHFIVTRTGKDDRPLAQRVPEEENNKVNDNQRRYSADGSKYITTITTTPSGPQGAIGIGEWRNPVVNRGLPDVQADVREKVAPVNLNLGDDGGEWWYLSDGRVGRYDHKGNRIV